MVQCGREVLSGSVVEKCCREVLCFLSVFSLCLFSVCMFSVCAFFCLCVLCLCVFCPCVFSVLFSFCEKSGGAVW